MDSLSGFSVFVQVADTRSFVSAGRQLGLSPSAVGKNVARLEEKLGVRLFHRSTRSITLTAEGALFLERCRRILAEVEAAQLELSQASGKPTGRLRISLPMVSTLMLPVLGDFMRQYPDIALDLDFTDQLVEVIEEGFDAVIRTGEPADSRLSARHLGYFSALLVASPAYLAEKGTPQAPGDLLRHHCLHYRFPHTGKLEKWPLRGRPTWRSPPQWFAIISKLASALHCVDWGLPVCRILPVVIWWLTAVWCRSSETLSNGRGRFISCGPPAAMLHRKSVRWLIFLLPECFRHESGAG